MAVRGTGVRWPGAGHGGVAGGDAAVRRAAWGAAGPAVHASGHAPRSGGISAGEGENAFAGEFDQSVLVWPVSVHGERHPVRPDLQLRGGRAGSRPGCRRAAARLRPASPRAARLPSPGTSLRCRRGGKSCSVPGGAARAATGEGAGFLPAVAAGAPRPPVRRLCVPGTRRGRRAPPCPGRGASPGVSGRAGGGGAARPLTLPGDPAASSRCPAPPSQRRRATARGSAGSAQRPRPPAGPTPTGPG